MFEKSQKKPISVLAPLSLAVAMALGAGAVHAAAHGGGHYLSDGSGMGVTNGQSKCWATTGGAAKGNCGGAMPAKKMPAKDSDGDGVVDAHDECPNTPKGVAVTAFGCPKDSDGDGVPDYKDACPGTSHGAKVDAKGCEIINNIVINTTADHFDFDSATLKPAMKAALDDVAAKVKASAGDEQLEVIGHTDSSGPEAYNQILSERRAQSAADYLAGQGLTGLSVKGMGESSPVADNGTRKGRSMNRRVEIRTK